MARRQPTKRENIELLIFIACWYFLNNYITNFFLNLQAKILGGKDHILTSPGFYSYRLIGITILLFIFLIYCFIFYKAEQRKIKIFYTVATFVAVISILMCFLSVNIFFRDRVVKYSARYPVGKTYEYRNIDNVTLKISSGRKMGVSIEYNLHMIDGTTINTAGDASKFYDCFKVEDYISPKVPHTTSSYYVKKFSDEGIVLPAEFYRLFKVVN